MSKGPTIHRRNWQTRRLCCRPWRSVRHCYCRDLESKSHTTQPPGRYNEATLTRTLEEMGIGRPSTYAAIIDTILARDYVTKRGNALMPTWTAIAVSQLLEAHLPDLVDYRFTAQMEDELDSISRGESEYLAYLRSFYFGNGRAGLKKQLENKVEQIDARDVCRILLGKPTRARYRRVYVRVGRFGPFLQQGERRASIPDGFPPDDLSMDAALKMLDQASLAEEPLGICPDTHKPVYLKTGRFGPYVQRGIADDEEKPQNASLLKGMKPEEIDLAAAIKLLSLPRELGLDPKSGEKVMAYNGRFGPYVKCGAETRSLPSDISPIDVTFEQALELAGTAEEATAWFRRAAGAAESARRIAGHQPADPTARRPLWAVRNRRRLQRVASQRRHGGRTDRAAGIGTVGGTSRQGTESEGQASSGQEGGRRQAGEKSRQEIRRADQDGDEDSDQEKGRQEKSPPAGQRSGRP